MAYKHILKVGLGIVAFEGTEHLYNIISELRDVVDYVCIGYLTLSYHGDKIDPTDLAEIKRLYEDDKIVDNIIDIHTDIKAKPRVQETEKRNQLIQDAENHGCSHCIIIDSDEYYNKSSFKKALDMIDENDYEITYCQYINYYHDYMHYLVYPFKQGMYVPFVTKVKYRHSFECTDFPYPSDPTRRYVRPYHTEIKSNNGKVTNEKVYDVDYHIFDWSEVKMHHLSWIRNDIRKKLYNWSSKQVIANYQMITEKAIYNFEHFDENSDSGYATLLFNTKDNQLEYKKLDKQYINPKVDISTRSPQQKSYKKIIVLNMSSTNSPVDLFNKLENTARNTWAKDILDNKYPNITYWKVIDSNEHRVDPERHTIYIRSIANIPNIYQLFYRFVKAVELLQQFSIKFDYVVRTNTSTWINIGLINEILAYQTDYTKCFTSCLYSAFWSTFHLYMSGNAMIFSSQMYKYIHDKYIEFKMHSINNVMDDVLMSSLIYSVTDQIGYNDYDKQVPLGCIYYKDLYKDTDFSTIDFAAPFVQIKTFDDQPHQSRLENDLKKMHEVDRLYREGNFDITDLYEKNKVRKNKVYMLPYSKEEFMSMDSEFKKDVQFKNLMDLEDAETLSLELRKKYYNK